jgi:hypothetical protein
LESLCCNPSLTELHAALRRQVFHPAIIVIIIIIIAATTSANTITALLQAGV